MRGAGGRRGGDGDSIRKASGRGVASLRTDSRVSFGPDATAGVSAWDEGSGREGSGTDRRTAVGTISGRMMTSRGAAGRLGGTEARAGPTAGVGTSGFGRDNDGRGTAGFTPFATGNDRPRKAAVAIERPIRWAELKRPVNSRNAASRRRRSRSLPSTTLAATPRQTATSKSGIGVSALGDDSGRKARQILRAQPVGWYALSSTAAMRQGRSGRGRVVARTHRIRSAPQPRSPASPSSAFGTHRAGPARSGGAGRLARGAGATSGCGDRPASRSAMASSSRARASVSRFRSNSSCRGASDFSEVVPPICAEHVTRRLRRLQAWLASSTKTGREARALSSAGSS